MKIYVWYVGQGQTFYAVAPDVKTARVGAAGCEQLTTRQFDQVALHEPNEIKDAPACWLAYDTE